MLALHLKLKSKENDVCSADEVKNIKTGPVEPQR